MNQTVRKPKSAKSVALAMILNAMPLVIFGAGYLYIGKWARFIAVEFLQLFCLTAFFVWGLRTQNLFAMVWCGSVIDVVIQTLNINQQIGNTTDQSSSSFFS